jgi:hypothetical protein
VLPLTDRNYQAVNRAKINNNKNQSEILEAIDYDGCIPQAFFKAVPYVILPGAHPSDAKLE